MGNLYIASKPVVVNGVNTGENHLYIVYDANGDLSNTNDQWVIRGGINSGAPYINNDGNLLLEIGVRINESADQYDADTGLTPTHRGMIPLNLNGQNAEEIWEAMKAYADSLGENGFTTGIVYDSGGTLRNTSLDYDIPLIEEIDGVLNSNAVIRSILAAHDITLEENLPANVSDLDELPGQSIVFSGGGNDTLLIGDNVEFIDGGSGSDTADFSHRSAEVTVDLGKEGILTTVAGVGDPIKGIENIVGSQFNDTITGDVGVNILNGGSGVDTIKGGLGNDIILGGVGNDILNGEGGIDNVDGGVGNDTIVFRKSDHSVVLSGNEVLNGGDDVDTLRLEFRSSELTPALRNEILEVYRDMVLNPQPGGYTHTFTNLNLQISNFENLEVWVDGKQVSLVLEARDAEEWQIYNYDPYTYVHLTHNQTTPTVWIKDYSFADTTLYNWNTPTNITVISGTFSTTAGGTVTIDETGYGTYTPPTGFLGVDSFNYTITDISGQSSTATHYINVLDHVSFGDPYVSYTLSVASYVNGGLAAGDLQGSSQKDYFNIEHRWYGGITNETLTIHAGGGNDRIEIDHITSSSLGDENISTEILYGEDGDDTITVDWTFDAYISGGNGNDEIYVHAEDFELYGNDGNDILSFRLGGGLDNNINIGIIDGGAGDDLLRYHVDGVGDVPLELSVNGGSGIDTLTFINGNAGTIYADLTTGVADVFTGMPYEGTINWSITNVENLTGGLQNDVFTGNSAVNILNGGKGDDILNGAGGDDILIGGRKMQ